VTKRLRVELGSSERVAKLAIIVLSCRSSRITGARGGSEGEKRDSLSSSPTLSFNLSSRLKVASSDTPSA